MDFFFLITIYYKIRLYLSHTTLETLTNIILISIIVKWYNFKKFLFSIYIIIIIIKIKIFTLKKFN